MKEPRYSILHDELEGVYYVMHTTEDGRYWVAVATFASWADAVEHKAELEADSNTGTDENPDV